MRIVKVLLLAIVISLLAVPVFATEHFVVIPNGGGFFPAIITIEQGDMVTWTNFDQISSPHNATSDDGLWDTGSIPLGDSRSETLNLPAGDYMYSCTFHEYEQGMITINALSIPTLDEWGMLLMGLLLLAVGTVAIVRSKETALGQNS
ncbi:MAG: IPTL-CTERM sorting domain-containing protein [candidate division Zixibacteria bacterium]